MNHFWSEPYKYKSLWYIDKVNKESGKVIQSIELTGKKLAETFLNTVHIYINGELMYDGI